MAVEVSEKAIAAALGLVERKVQAVLRLVAEGGTVPFVARYRKEATGGLDEVQIRAVVELPKQLRSLEERRASIIDAIEKQGKLSDDLRRRLLAAPWEGPRQWRPRRQRRRSSRAPRQDSRPRSSSRSG